MAEETQNPAAAPEAGSRDGFLDAERLSELLEQDFRRYPRSFLEEVRP